MDDKLEKEIKKGLEQELSEAGISVSSELIAKTLSRIKENQNNNQRAGMKLIDDASKNEAAKKEQSRKVASRMKYRRAFVVAAALFLCIVSMRMVFIINKKSYNENLSGFENDTAQPQEPSQNTGGAESENGEGLLGEMDGGNPEKGIVTSPESELKSEHELSSGMSGETETAKQKDELSIILPDGSTRAIAVGSEMGKMARIVIEEIKNAEAKEYKQSESDYLEWELLCEIEETFQNNKRVIYKIYDNAYIIIENVTEDTNNLSSCVIENTKAAEALIQLITKQ